MGHGNAKVSVALRRSCDRHPAPGSYVRTLPVGTNMQWASYYAEFSRRCCPGSDTAALFGLLRLICIAVRAGSLGPIDKPAHHRCEAARNFATLNMCPVTDDDTAPGHDVTDGPVACGKDPAVEQGIAGSPGKGRL